MPLPPINPIDAPDLDGVSRILTRASQGIVSGLDDASDTFTALNQRRAKQRSGQALLKLVSARTQGEADSAIRNNPVSPDDATPELLAALAGTPQRIANLDSTEASTDSTRVITQGNRDINDRNRENYALGETARNNQLKRDKNDSLLIDQAIKKGQAKKAFRVEDVEVNGVRDPDAFERWAVNNGIPLNEAEEIYQSSKTGRTLAGPGERVNNILRSIDEYVLTGAGDDNFALLDVDQFRDYVNGLTKSEKETNEVIDRYLRTDIGRKFFATQTTQRQDQELAELGTRLERDIITDLGPDGNKVLRTRELLNIIDRVKTEGYGQDIKKWAKTFDSQGKIFGSDGLTDKQVSEVHYWLNNLDGLTADEGIAIIEQLGHSNISANWFRTLGFNHLSQKAQNAFKESATNLQEPKYRGYIERLNQIPEQVKTARRDMVLGNRRKLFKKKSPTQAGSTTSGQNLAPTPAPTTGPTTNPNNLSPNNVEETARRVRATFSGTGEAQQTSSPNALNPLISGSGDSPAPTITQSPNQTLAGDNVRNTLQRVTAEPQQSVAGVISNQSSPGANDVNIRNTLNRVVPGSTTDSQSLVNDATQVIRAVLDKASRGETPNQSFLNTANQTLGADGKKAIDNVLKTDALTKEEKRAVKLVLDNLRKASNGR